MNLDEETLIASRRLSSAWHYLEPEEYVTGVYSVATRSAYLCHSISFYLNSGRVISAKASHGAWDAGVGRSFSVGPVRQSHERLLDIKWETHHGLSNVTSICFDIPVV